MIDQNDNLQKQQCGYKATLADLKSWLYVQLACFDHMVIAGIGRHIYRPFSLSTTASRPPLARLPAPPSLPQPFPEPSAPKAPRTAGRESHVPSWDDPSPGRVAGRTPPTARTGRGSHAPSASGREPPAPPTPRLVGGNRGLPGPPARLQDLGGPGSVRSGPGLQPLCADPGPGAGIWVPEANPRFLAFPGPGTLLSQPVREGFFFWPGPQPPRISDT